MGASAPDSVRRLVDLFDREREVYQSPDYKEEQLRVESPNGPCRTIRHSDFAVWTCLEGFCMFARRSDFGVCTFLDPFFTALGWDLDKTPDTVKNRNWGSVPFFP
jgi:hypothetical protein